MFGSDIGIDLGTATVLIYVKNKGVVLRGFYAIIYLSAAPDRPGGPRGGAADAGKGEMERNISAPIRRLRPVPSGEGE